MQDKSSEDDYDFLKEGRKQTEERLQRARATVKSMAQSAEARDQYRRLLNVLTDIQGSMVRYYYYFDILLSLSLSLHFFFSIFHVIILFHCVSIRNIICFPFN